MATPTPTAEILRELLGESPELMDQDAFPEALTPTRTTYGQGTPGGQPSLDDLMSLGNVRVEGPRPTEREAVSQLTEYTGRQPRLPMSPTGGKYETIRGLEEMGAGAPEGTNLSQFAALQDIISPIRGEVQAEEKAEREQASKLALAKAPAEAAFAARQKAAEPGGVLESEQEIEAKVKKGLMGFEMGEKLKAEALRLKMQPVATSGVGSMFTRADMDDPTKRDQLLNYFGIQTLLASGQGMQGLTTMLGQMTQLGVFGEDKIDQRNVIASIFAASWAQLRGGNASDYYTVTTKGGRQIITLRLTSPLGTAQPTAQSGGGFNFPEMGFQAPGGGMMP